ncbi:hypothetical protein HWV07_18305 [Natronomonas salina]|uniref:hypothetical protein n=1 Tax=Natronomonas salina TaxID=1710540 RepID=UPI0015B5868F|nr:hypothetical protein [Natronomonas salina]QLD90891.1 hypothetical protein HWV07_18305 [Natronomonas salina]
MTTNAAQGTNLPSKRRKYRYAMYGCLAVGIAGYLLGLQVEMPLAALAVYWAAFLGFLGIQRGSSVTIYDERHHALERKAAKRTIGVVGAVLILVGPALPALSAAGYEPPTLVLGALYGYAAMFFLLGAFCIGMRCWK